MGIAEEGILRGEYRLIPIGPQSIDIPVRLQVVNTLCVVSVK